MSEERRQLATIMFTDMVGYSALTQKNEALALTLLDEQRRRLRALFAEHRGREIEAVGDGFFVEFGSALDGARCAVAIQQALFERNATVPADQRIQVRIGLHLGDVVHREDRVPAGDGVNIAARIEPLAEPGGICLSEDVARQIQNKLEPPLRKLGKGELKNIQLPVDIYRVVLPWERPHLPFSERVAFAWRRKRTRRIAVGAAGVLVVLAVAGVYVSQRAGGPTGAAATRRVAVLPFVNISADAADEYFADGMTEEVISRLSRIGGLDVIARTSVMQYKGKPQNISDIGRVLGVDTVLEGSVRKAGDKVRITVQLIHVPTQGHLWSEDYDRDFKDIFVVQSDIAERVARTLKVRLVAAGRRQIESGRPQNLEAYTSYLRGRQQWGKITPEGLKKSVEFFNQAIAREPEYATAFAGLADAYALIGWFNILPARDSFPRAKAAATEALRIDDSLAGAHAALGLVKFFYDWDWRGAEAEFRRGIELSPSYALGHLWYGIYLKAMGERTRAMAEIRRSQELDPLSLMSSAEVGWAFFFARQFDEAIKQCRKTLEMDSGFFFAKWCLEYAYIAKGMWADAELMARDIAEQLGDPAYLVDVYAYEGKRAEAKEILEALKKKAPRTSVSPSVFAWNYSVLGEMDEAFEWWEKAYESRETSLVFLREFPLFEKMLRTDPRFDTLLKKIGHRPL